MTDLSAKEAYKDDIGISSKKMYRDDIAILAEKAYREEGLWLSGLIPPHNFLPT